MLNIIDKTNAQYVNMDGKDFVKDICAMNGWMNNSSNGSDNGVDAWTVLEEPIQIKNKVPKVTPYDITLFFGTLKKYKKNKGYFVAWDYSKQALDLIAELKLNNKVEIVSLFTNELLKC